MFGLKKLWGKCEARFASQREVETMRDRYWVLRHELEAMKRYLNLRYEEPQPQEGRMVPSKVKP